MAQLELSKSILYGTAIADATIQKSHENGNARIRVGHSIDKSEYLIWKYKHLKRLFPITAIGVIEGGKYIKSPNDYVYFTSHRDATLTEIFNLLYKSKRKIITDELLFQIDDTALAVWYMDDGYYDKHIKIQSYSLNTNAFDENENEKIIDYLKFRFNLNPKKQYVKRQNQWIIKFPKSDSRLIQDIIEPTVKQIQCMHYKLPSYHNQLTKGDGNGRI